jgi:hypothetical protein
LTVGVGVGSWHRADWPRSVIAAGDKPKSPRTAAKPRSRLPWTRPSRCSRKPPRTSRQHQPERTCQGGMSSDPITPVRGVCQLFHNSASVTALQETRHGLGPVTGVDTVCGRPAPSETTCSQWPGARVHQAIGEPQTALGPRCHPQVGRAGGRFPRGTAPGPEPEPAIPCREEVPRRTRGYSAGHCASCGREASRRELICSAAYPISGPFKPGGPSRAHERKGR